jgi:hypothetical protein
MYKLIRDGQYKSKELKMVNDKSEWLKISTIIAKKESTNRFSILLSADKPIGFFTKTDQISNSARFV